MSNLELKVNSSIGLLEKFESNFGIIEDCIETISDPETNKLGKVTLKELRQLLTIFEKSFNPIDLADNANLAGLSFKSKIYSLGLAPEIIRLRNAGNSIKDIANNFNINDSTVSRFLKHFDSLAAVTKSKIKSNSVMNTTDRLEDLMTMILRQLHRLEGVNDDVHVKYIGELRQTLGLAAQVSEKITTYKTYQNFREAVQEILANELPERRLEIIQKFKLLQGAESNNGLPLALNPRY